LGVFQWHHAYFYWYFFLTDISLLILNRSLSTNLMWGLDATRAPPLYLHAYSVIAMKVYRFTSTLSTNFVRGHDAVRYCFGFIQTHSKMSCLIHKWFRPCGLVRRPHSHTSPFPLLNLQLLFLGHQLSSYLTEVVSSIRCDFQNSETTCLHEIEK